MRQLPLDIRPAEHAVFASYFPGGNAAAVDAVRRASAGEGLAVTWLAGPQDVGKSHLLQAGVAAAHARGAGAAYLPMPRFRDLTPAALEGMEALDLIALDDVEVIAADEGWERGLLRLYEALLARGGRLLLAGAIPPAAAGFRLPDLASRLRAAAVFLLAPLGDEDCLQALRLRAAWRGFSLPEETGRFLLSRLDRGTGSLFRVLDRLDRAGLAAQKRLTVPFVRSVLEGGD